MIEMMVHSLVDGGDRAVLVLKEVEGKRDLQIIVGPYEAVAILRHLSGIREQRPLTHDLMKNLVEEMGGEVKGIRVNDLRSDVYYGVITVGMEGREVEVDARPSDAIALAVRFGAPIYVEERVIEEANRTAGERKEEAEVEKKFREIVQGLEFEEPG